MKFTHETALRFLREKFTPLIEPINDPFDCSVALAIAVIDHCQRLHVQVCGLPLCQTAFKYTVAVALHSEWNKPQSEGPKGAQ